MILRSNALVNVRLGAGAAAYAYITVHPAPVASANLSTVGGPGTVAAVSGVPAPFTITAFDRFGNRRQHGGDAFAAWFDGTPLALGGSPTRDTYSGSYTPVSATLYAVPGDPASAVASTLGQLRVTLSGQPVATLAVPVAPGALDVTVSAVESRSSPQLVAGTFESFMVAARDGAGNHLRRGLQQRLVPRQLEQQPGRQLRAAAGVPGRARVSVVAGVRRWVPV